MGEGGHINLTTAIEAFNESSRPQIELREDPHLDFVEASLPRVGREIIVSGTEFTDQVKVTAEDVAWLCEEARRASAPGMALLEAALRVLSDLDDRV